LKFLQRLQQAPVRNFKSKSGTGKLNVASAPFVLKFVSVGAASGSRTSKTGH
jgi:hypothetical protein